MDATDEFDLDDLERRMKGALQALKSDFASLRTGRASASLLDPVEIEAYGQKMGINQLGTVTVPEPRMVAVQVWDKSMVSAVEKGIRNSGLGLNPVVDGTLIRLPIPELNEERRQEMAKLASKYAERARVAMRNVRRDGMDHLKRLEKAGNMSEDDQKFFADEVQKLTDAQIAEVDKSLAAKEQEIMQV